MLAGVVGANNCRLATGNGRRKPQRQSSSEQRSASPQGDHIRNSQQAKGGAMSSQVSALRLFDLIQSQRVTAVIYVAARLGLAELLRDGPQATGALAKATGADERALG